MSSYATFLNQYHQASRSKDQKNATPEKTTLRKTFVESLYGDIRLQVQKYLRAVPCLSPTQIDSIVIRVQNQLNTPENTQFDRSTTVEQLQQCIHIRVEQTIGDYLRCTEGYTSFLEGYRNGTEEEKQLLTRALLHGFYEDIHQEAHLLLQTHQRNLHITPNSLTNGIFLQLMDAWHIQDVNRLDSVERFRQFLRSKVAWMLRERQRKEANAPKKLPLVPEDRIDQDDQTARVIAQEAIDTLEAKLKEVLRADQVDLIRKNILEGYSYVEIAREYGLTEDAIRKRVDRALDKLKKIFQTQDVF